MRNASVSVGVVSADSVVDSVMFFVGEPYDTLCERDADVVNDTDLNDIVGSLVYEELQDTDHVAVMVGVNGSCFVLVNVGLKETTVTDASSEMECEVLRDEVLVRFCDMDAVAENEKVRRERETSAVPLRLTDSEEVTSSDTVVERVMFCDAEADMDIVLVSTTLLTIRMRALSGSHTIVDDCVCQLTKHVMVPNFARSFHPSAYPLELTLPAYSFGHGFCTVNVCIDPA